MFVGDDRKPKSDCVSLKGVNIYKYNVFKSDAMRNVCSKTKRNRTEMFLYASRWQEELYEFSVV